MSMRADATAHVKIMGGHYNGRGRGRRRVKSASRYHRLLHMTRRNHNAISIGDVACMARQLYCGNKVALARCDKRWRKRC